MKLCMKNILVLILTFTLTACGGGFSTPDTPNPDNNNGGGNSGDTIQLFFSKPDPSGNTPFINGPEENLVTAIDNAQTSIDIAIYELSLENITLSLIRAHQRGVIVRVLTDSDHLDWARFIQLANAGIPVRGDGRSSLMHNKFTVIDNTEVWTGSMNLTYTGAFQNRENLIRLSSPQAATNYSEEFSQLWAGIHNQSNSANNFFSINNSAVDIHFSPDDNFRSSRLLPLLQNATQSVHLMAFSFTSQDIADALVVLHQRGLNVEIIVDSGQAGQASSQYDDLLVLNLNIRRDGQSHKLHHKVIIIDGRYVVTGSYNFSENAESRNDENSVVIDNQAIAQLFEQEFSDINNHSVAKSAVKSFAKDEGY